MYYHPCAGCKVDKDKCNRRSEIRSAIAGLSVTSIKFKCEDRVPLFRSGQRVTFFWTVYSVECDYYADDPDVTQFNGTIIRETKSPWKYAIRVDQDADDYDFAPKDVFKGGGFAVNVRTSDILAIDEPDRKFCPSCLKYQGEDGLCQAFPGAGWDRYVPDGCLEHDK